MSYNSNANAENPQDNKCPRQHIILQRSKGKWRWCCHRTCPNEACMQYWAKQEYAKLRRSHKVDPFTHVIRITPGIRLTTDELRDYIRDTFNAVKKYCHNRKLKFTFRLYPEQHGNSVVHYYGFVRLGNDKVIYHLREQLQTLRSAIKGTWSLKPPRTKVAFIRYAFWRQGKIKNFPKVTRGQAIIGKVT